MEEGAPTASDTEASLHIFNYICGEGNIIFQHLTLWLTIAPRHCHADREKGGPYTCWASFTRQGTFPSKAQIGEGEEHIISDNYPPCYLSGVSPLGELQSDSGDLGDEAGGEAPSDTGGVEHSDSMLLSWERNCGNSASESEPSSSTCNCTKTCVTVHHDLNTFLTTGIS